MTAIFSTARWTIFSGSKAAGDIREYPGNYSTYLEYRERAEEAGRPEQRGRSN